MIKKIVSHITLYLFIINLFSSFLFTDITYANNNSNDDLKIKGLLSKNIKNSDYAKDRIIVKFKKNKYNSTSLSTLKTKVGKKSFKKLDYFDKVDVGVLSFDENTNSINTIINDLKKMPDVEYVEKDYIRTISYSGVTTNDTRSNEQWYLKSIQADEAWKIYNDTQDKITVSINDSGIDYTHPDLLPNMKDLSTNCKSDTGATIVGGCPNHGLNYEDILYGTTSVLPYNDIYDINGHGSHVAGIIGAEGNNGTGVIGVTQNVEMIGARLETYNLYDGVFYVSNIIKGINFAIQNGAKIINASYGGPNYSQAEYDALNTAKSNGILFITAAGNESTNTDIIPSYPDGYDLDNIIAVASVGSDDNLAYYSNYGNTNIDVAAPGGNSIIDSGILSTTPLEQVVYENGLTSFSGTTTIGTNPDWYLYGGGFGYHTQTPLYYTGGLDYKLFFDQSFSLEGADSAKLKGYISCDFGSGYFDADTNDRLSFYIYDNDKSQSIWLDTFYKDYNGDIEIPIINSSFFKNNLNLWMNFVTDNDTDVGQGCRIDNLSIEKYSKNSHGYKAFQGTSMATPVVTGLASMLWSYKPDLTYSEVKDIILSSVDLIPSLNGKVVSNGKINAKNAIKELISRYGITKNGTFQNASFNVPFVNLNGKNITLSGSTLNFSSTGTVISLSGSTINGNGDLNIGTGTNLFNNGVNIFNTSTDFNIHIKNSSGTLLNNSATINGDSLILDYTGSKLGNLNIIVTKDLGGVLYNGPLGHDISFPINESYYGGISAKVYNNGDGINGISTGVLLNIIDKKILDNITLVNGFTITGSLSFASGAYTNNRSTIVNINSNTYPVDYSITGDIIGTVTGTLSNSGSRQVQLTGSTGTTGDRNLSLLLSKNGQTSNSITGSIILDENNPHIYFNSHTNNQFINQTSTTLIGTVTDGFGQCDQVMQILGLCSESGISSLIINGTGVTLSGSTFSKNIDLSLGNNIIPYEVTDNAGNVLTGSITLIRAEQLIGNIEFASGTSTNNIFTSVNLSNSEYPVTYLLSGSIVGTYTGVLNNSGSLQVELTSGDGNKNVSAFFYSSGNIQSYTNSVNIVLDTNLPNINFISHTNNQIVNQSIITLSGKVLDGSSYCDEVSQILGLCSDSGISSLIINGTGVTLGQRTQSGNTFTKNISLNPGNNNITYEVTDNAGNTLTGSINISRIGTTSNIISNILSSNSVNISFNSELSSIGEILYGTTQNSLNSSKLGTLGTNHSITLTGLTPNTDYFFKVRGNNNGYTGTLSDLQTFSTTSAYDVDNSTGNTSNTGSISFTGSNFSGTGAYFNGTGSLIIHSNSGGHGVVLSLSGLTIHSNGWNGIFNPPRQSSFSGTFNNGGYTHIPALTFKIGNDSSELSLSGNTAQVNIFVGTSYNGKTLGVFRSTNNGTSYNLLKTCLISAGICSFTTDKFSFFTLGTQVTTTLGSSSSSSSTSGGGSSSGGSSSGGFGGSMTATRCLDTQLECKTTTLENGFKWYRKDGVSCEGGNLGTTCNLDQVVINNSEIGKIQPVKYLNDGYEFKSKILESVFNKKVSSIINIDNIISSISYLGKDISEYMYNYRNTYNKLLESIHKIDDLLSKKDIDGVRTEFKDFIQIHKELSNFKYEGKIKNIDIDGNKVPYLIYSDTKITKIQKLLLSKLEKKKQNTYMYRLANKVVNNLNNLLTDKSLTKEEIQAIREETISYYKQFIVEYNKLEKK